MGLFDEEYGVNNAPEDSTQITQVIIYLDAPDAILFKKLCKEGMKVEYPGNYIEEGNMSKLLFKIVKEKYENLLPKTTDEAAPSGSPSGDISLEDEL